MLILQVVPAAAVEPDELVDLSLEELGNIVITSVSKRPERIADAPASVYVISAEDIRRSGATILPEILRLAPNLQVARISSSEYAISSRGFNNATGNKLQVLLDGRVLYTPLFSGVFWDTQDTLLEDIERIEVISGAGATLWGANAVNGVINIITRSAADSTGSLLSAAVGSHEHDAAMRYDAGAVRFYGRAVDHDATTRIDGSRRPDQWRRAQVGFRADWGTPLEGQTLQGDLYGGNFDSSAVDDLEISGVNLLGRWNHQLSNGDGFQVQAYADHLVRDIPDSIRERLDVYDLQFQHDLKGIEGHALLWGAGYRVAIDDVRNATNIAFLPARRQLHWGHVFIQDSMRLADERFELTGGVRVSNNSYSGSEWMPSVRLAFKPAPAHLLWSALSRAVRTPSRLDRELYAPAQAPFLIAGGPDFESEISNTLDLGYRAQTTANSSLSITLYHHRYDQLRTFERTPAVSFVIANKMRGSGTGAEVWGSLQPHAQWRFEAGAAWLDQNLRLAADSTDAAGIRAAGNDPTVQWFLRARIDLRADLEIDAALRHVGALPDPQVAAYSAFDLRLGWRPRDSIELAISARNLFDPSHPEFGNALTASEIERSVLMSATWQF